MVIGQKDSLTEGHITLYLRMFLASETDLVMETGAGLRAVHPAVAGQEGAAPAQREAVRAVLAHEAVRWNLMEQL